MMHIVFLGKTEADIDMLSSSLADSSMLGLSADCTFEVIDSNDVYEYKHNGQDRIVCKSSEMSSYFNLQVSDLPDDLSSLLDLS